MKHEGEDEDDYSINMTIDSSGMLYGGVGNGKREMGSGKWEMGNTNLLLPPQACKCL